MAVAHAHKELRFTRAGQAVGFWIVAAVMVMTALVFVLVAPYRAEHTELPHPAWGLIPLGLAAFSTRLAIRCTRHAYLILSPIGVEIFPLFRPESDMQLIAWAQIDSTEIDDRRLTLHYNPEKTAGLHLSLLPIAKNSRKLLAAAILGRATSSHRQSPDSTLHS
jgi:hypothetical protein